MDLRTRPRSAGACPGADSPRLGRTATHGPRWALLLGLLAGVLLPSAAGCKAIALPFLMWGPEPTRDVPAEYPYLADKKVCLLVWADTETLLQYPNVQLEVSEHLRVALEAGVKGLRVVPNREVAALQRREPSWERTRAPQIGARFEADRVLEVMLTEYTTREPDSPHLYRGHISATVRVYDVSQPEAAAAYRTEVRTAYPPERMGEYGTDERTIRRQTMEAFAADVAAKFFDRKVKIR